MTHFGVLLIAKHNGYQYQVGLIWIIFCESINIMIKWNSLPLFSNALNNIWWSPSFSTFIHILICSKCLISYTNHMIVPKLFSPVCELLQWLHKWALLSLNAQRKLTLYNLQQVWHNVHVRVRWCGLVYESAYLLDRAVCVLLTLSLVCIWQADEHRFHP